MTYLISRANYERCVAGMNDADRAAFDREFMCYPTDLEISPDGRISLDRVADTYAQLVARETGMPPLLTFKEVRERTTFAGWDLVTTTAPYAATTWVNCARGNGKSNWQPPDPWRELGENCYVAPAGTPAPFLYPDPGPAPTIRELAEQENPWDHRYIHVDDWAAAMDDETSEIRRGWLNTTVVAKEPEPRDVIADMLAWWRKYNETIRRARAQRIAAGDVALTAFQFAGRPAKLRASNQVVVDISGIPIVADPDLPEDVWQLVDAETGDVMLEGVVGGVLMAMLREMRERLRENIADLAARTNTPPDLLGY